MKKLSLVLALVLVLTCGVLAACDDTAETSSAADVQSSEVKTESSATAEESSEATAESSEATAESSDVDESKEPIAAGTENLAAGKTYVRSLLYRQGSADIQYAWDENAPIAYPDENDSSFTDGVIGATDSSFSDAAWAGFSLSCPDYATNGNYSYITVDLGQAYDLAKLVAYVGSSGLTAGIGADGMNVVFAVSADGKTFEVVGEVAPVDDPNASCLEVALELDTAVNGRYVQFRFSRGGWIFVSEVEAYAAAE